ncbi:MAG: hypothetical protein JSS53_10545, partial [Proteobacteria bacterium]|nr:hypothetical protein [Pseudomonadota bacterium]
MDMTLEKPASVMLMQANLIHELCKPLFDSSGIAYFAYVEIFENGDFIFLNSDAKLYSALLKTKVVQRLPYKILHHPIRLGLQLADLESESYFADPEISHFLKTFNLGSLFRFATLETGVRGLSLRLYTYAGKANQTESNYYCINN